MSRSSKGAKLPIGRPSEYEGKEAEIIETIAQKLEAGTPLLVICREKGMPGAVTIYSWIASNPEFSERIARGRDIGYDVIANECLAIADDTSLDTIETEHGERPDSEWIARSKLRVETRLKLLAKWDPKRYGDAVPQNNVTVGVGVNVTALTEDRRKELMDKKQLAIAHRSKPLPPSNGKH